MLKLFRLCSTLAILSAGSLLASSHPCPGQWEVSAEFLYMKPTFDDTYFVISSPTSTTFPNGRREHNDFDFEPGFRIGGKYAFCDCNREFDVAYTYLGDNKSRKAVTGDNLWATVGRADLVSSFENYTGGAFSQLDVLYQRLDATFGQQIFNWCCVDLYLNFGLEYAYLRLNEDYAYVSETEIGLVHQKSRSWGIGPQFGFAVDYELYQCTCYLPGTLSLVARSSASLLASESSTLGQNAAITETVAPLLNVSDSSTWRTIPALHAQVGLNYDFPCSCVDVNLEIGYEFSSYIRGLARTSYPDDVADGLAVTNYYNFDVQGLYVSAGVRF